jgi:hypothetical protein
MIETGHKLTLLSCKNSTIFSVFLMSGILSSRPFRRCVKLASIYRYFLGFIRFKIITKYTPAQTYAIASWKFLMGVSTAPSGPPRYSSTFACSIKHEHTSRIHLVRYTRWMELLGSPGDFSPLEIWTWKTWWAALKARPSLPNMNDQEDGYVRSESEYIL